MQKLRGRIFRRFWVKEPRHSENISDEKCYLYRGTRPFFFSDCYWLESLDKVVDHTLRLKRWLLFFYRVQIHAGISRGQFQQTYRHYLPLPAIESGRIGRSGLTS